MSVMLNIAIIDRNKTYRESLKTVLEQIEDFRVALDNADCTCLLDTNILPVQVVLLDISVGKEKCTHLVKKAEAAKNPASVILLAMYKDELKSGYGQTEILLKSSSKREFEKTIRKIAGIRNECQTTT